MLPLALGHIDCWIFDLDNSLYPASTNLFALIDARMNAFIRQLLGCGEAEARAVRKRHFRDNGTTLSGLMASHGIDPRTFLDYVHDIDLARLSADPLLVAALDRLPGRKLVFTNGDEAHARRVLDRLGLGNAFDGLHDIHAMNYVPKPDPRAYAAICQRYEIAPERALLVEDMARNLAPAKALGMTTVWIDNGSEQASQDGDPAFIDCRPPFIDYRVADIGLWLSGLGGEECE